MTEKPRCHVCNKTDTETSSEGTLKVDIIGSCVSCHKYFCTEHMSEFDRTLCSSCVSYANTMIEKKPIIDEDGVKHKGYQLILTGEAWMRSRDVISKMTDGELDVKLEVLKRAVHEAEMVLDYRRIIHNQVENEKSGRLSRKLGRLRLISAVDQAHKSVPHIIDGSKPKVSVNNVKDALGALGKLGLNKDAIANLLLKLAQSKTKETK